MFMNQKLDDQINYVFKYLIKSFFEAETIIKEEIQKMGLASVEDLSVGSQSLIIALEKDIEKLNSKNDQTVNEYYEDHFNLALSSLSENIVPNGQNNVLASNNSIINQSDATQFLFSKLREHNKENLKDDVLLKLTQHLNSKLSTLLNLLKDVLETNKNPDLKVLRERNIELTNQLKAEQQYRNDLAQKLLQAEKNAHDYFNQLEFNDEEFKNFDELKAENENLKQQIQQSTNEYRRWVKEKEELEKYKLLFKNNLPDLERKLKNDLENARQQIELIEKERDEALRDLVRLKTEKEKHEEFNRKLLKELELQKENYENDIKALGKQLDNQKKFIENQTQERENEYHESQVQIENLDKQLKEKETKILNYLEKVRQLEEQIELTNEEKQRLDKCYLETCSRLTDENKKNKQLQNLLEEYQKTKEKTQQTEKELRERLNRLEEDLNSQLKLNETLKKNQTEQSSAIVSSFVDNVCDIEQLRCSSVNPDVLKTMSLLDHQSNFIKESLQDEKNSQSDSLYGSSSNSYTFQDGKKLDKLNSQLDSLVQNLLRKNQDLNDELDEAKNLQQRYESKIQNLKDYLDKLKKNLEEIVREKEVLKACMDEKDDKLNEFKLKLKELQNCENKDTSRQLSIENLKKKLFDEEQKVQKLNEQLKKKDSELTEKQAEIYMIKYEIDCAKYEKRKGESDKFELQLKNKELSKEKERLEQEIEDLQNELDDFNEDDSDIREMFETLLKDKDEEIDNLNYCLDEINQKLKDCLPTSTLGQGSLTLLDELISYYKKYNSTKNKSNHLLNQLNHKSVVKKQLESESYDSLSPIGSGYEDQLSIDELSDDEDINSKLAGIHNNSVEICNLSFQFKSEKGLIKLINEIPEIVTNEKLSKKNINEWQANFIDCFSNKTIAQLITKNVISLRPTFLSNSPKKNNTEKQELIKQIESYKTKLKIEKLELKKSIGFRKALIFQKKYLMNLLKSNQEENRPINLRRKKSVFCKLNGFTKFRVVVFSLIAINRIRKIKENRELIENYDQIDLKNKFDQINQLRTELLDVLSPSVEKYSSFINSLHSSKRNQVPFNHLLDNNPNENIRHFEKNLKDLLDGLKEVYNKLGFDDTNFITSNTNSLSN